MTEDSIVTNPNTDKINENLNSTKNRVLNFLQNEYFIKVSSLLVLLLISVVIILPFVCSSQFGGHDFSYHLDSILSLNEAWQNGTFTSKIYSLICSDCGYGVGMFYSTIPASTTVIFMNIFNLDVVGAIGLFYFLLFFLSSLVVYFFCSRIFKKNWIALVCAIFYALFPYFLTNLYVRFAFSESVMMLNIPLIVWGIYELIENRNYKLFLPLFTIGYSLAILTHLTLTLYLTIFIAVYILINFRKFLSKYNWVPFVASVCLVLFITASFYIPMFVNIGATRSDSLSRTGMHLWATSVNIFKDDYLLASTIVMLAVYIVFCVVHFLRKKEERKSFNKYFIFFTVVVAFITPIFPWVILGFQPFNMIQFAWRIFALEGIVLAIMLGYILKYANKALFKSLVLICVNIALIVNFVVVGVNFTSKDTLQYTKDALSIDYVSHYEGMGGSKSGDYFPKIDYWDYYTYTAYRVNDNIILESDITIAEFSNYQSLNRIVFLIQDVENGYATLKIPYELTNENIYLVNQTSNPNSSLQPATSSQNIGGVDYLRFDFENLTGQYLVVIDYSNNEDLKNYLIENPFEFVVLEGEASFTNFVKTNTSTYTVDITVENSAKIELPTLYYSGYTITLTDEAGLIENVEGVHGSDGFIEIELNKSGTLSVKFNPTYIKAGNIISIIGAVMFAIVLLCALLIPQKYYTRLGNKITEFLNTHKTIAEILRFIIVGGIATIVDMFTMGVVMYLMERSIYPSFINVFINSPTPSTFATIMGTSVGFVVGLIVNYILSILFVFNEKGNSRTVKGFVVFTVLSVIGLIINIIGTYIGFDLLHLNQWLVKIIMIIIVLIYNYISKRLVLFKKKPETVQGSNIDKNTKSNTEDVENKTSNNENKDIKE